ncbi:MAG: Crp/Fnr family transcriptional regulator [Acidobacteria bacterium]|nr:Crp/Fnr family transcriptional regulator [Acidobacteriota bacterium]
MNNDLGRTNDYARMQTREARQAPAPNGNGAGQRAPSAVGFGFDPQWVRADSLNELRANRLLGALPAEDFSRLFPHLEPVSLAAGEVLYKLDAEMRHAYFPETAVISHLHILSEGGMTEADMVGREGMTGLSAVFGAPAPTYLTEVSLGGSALRVRVETLRQEFARGGALQQLLHRYASGRIALLSRRAVCNGNHRVEERLCTWLLMVHDRAGDAPLTLTHERISRHLGTRRAGVTSAATVLRDRGVIGYTRGHIRVLDREALQAAACECYPAVRESFAAVA